MARDGDYSELVKHLMPKEYEIARWLNRGSLREVDWLPAKISLSLLFFTQSGYMQMGDM